LGPSESEPAVVEWQWHDDVPGYAGVARWALIGVLLVLVKANRNWRAWTILIPFYLLGEIVWPWVERLFSFLSPGSGQYGLPFQWLVVAWTALWLLGPWLAKCRPPLAFVLALVLGAAIGLANGFVLYEQRHLGRPLTIYAVWLFALLLAFALSGLSCRKTYGAGRFLAWLVPWLVVGVAIGLVCEHLWLSLYVPGRLRPLAISYLMPQLALMSLCGAATLYLSNLPFMYLAFRCPPYRDRFRKILRSAAFAPPAMNPSGTPSGQGAPVAATAHQRGRKTCGG
jgi:hypothetical protein